MAHGFSRGFSSVKIQSPARDERTIPPSLRDFSAIARQHPALKGWAIVLRLLQPGQLVASAGYLLATSSYQAIAGNCRFRPCFSLCANDFGERSRKVVLWQASCVSKSMPLSAVCRKPQFSVFSLVLSSALMLVSQPPVWANESVTLAWNPSISTDVAGYMIYYGTASHVYTGVQPVPGNATSVTISGLVPGTTYYFAATAVDILGNESGFSNEASYTMPVTPAALLLSASPGGQFNFAVSGDAGQRYVVQASTNLLNWVSLQTNLAPFQFADTNAANFGRRFYRAFYLAP